MKFELMGGLCSPCGEVHLDMSVVLKVSIVPKILSDEVFEFFPTVLCDDAPGILSPSS